MAKPHFSQKELAKLPKSRLAVSYMVGMSRDFLHVLLKFQMWDGRTEIYVLTPGQAKFLLSCLRRYYADMEAMGTPILDARKTDDKALIENFEKKCPAMAADDWDANPPSGTRQTVATQFDGYRDAVFFIFAMNPIEKDDWRVVRLDPRLCHWIVDLIGEQENNLVDVGSMPPASRSVN